MNRGTVDIESIIKRYQGDRTRLMDIFWDAQEPKGYVSDSDLEAIAAGLHTSSADLREVLTFYHFFRSKPGGRFQIYLDSSIVAEHAGKNEIRDEFESLLGVKVGAITADGVFGLFETSCIGMSDQAPAALINMIPFTNLTRARAQRIVKALRSGVSLEDLVNEFGIGDGRNADPDVRSMVRNNIRKTGPYFFGPSTAGAALAKARAQTPESVIDEITKSGLRGRGGAGFPTGRKWAACRAVASPIRYVVCNADEGEPGTFKDRVLLTETPALLLEGMAIAGHAIGANEGIIYLRAEYRYLKRHLENEIAKFAAHAGAFKFRVQLGAGAYVCGEESALLESMEGKRGEPRLKPPFPAENGYLGRPTAVNNVETFILASRILERGAADFLNHGTQRSPGVRLLSISGDVEHPGIYEIHWGTKVSEVLAMCGASDPLMIQVGGPSGTCIRASDTHREISYEDLATGGSFMVFSRERNQFGVLENFMRFFVDESCGNCTPCRAGNVVLLELLQKFRDGHARVADLAKIDNWAKIVATSSRCGLGQTSPQVMTTSKAAFPELYKNAIPQGADELNFDFDVGRATQAYDDAIGDLK